MRLLKGGLSFLLRPGICRGPGRPLYQQGQSPSPRTREYFYYVDHQGQLFLDDAKVKNFITCFKGSSAGAGSGEFHVYRHLRWREYQRQDFMDAMAEKQKLDEEYLKKLTENKIAAEEQTAKRRRKRQKLKEKKMLAKKSKLEQKSEDAATDSDQSPKQQTSKEEDEDASEEEEKDDAEDPSFMMRR